MAGLQSLTAALWPIPKPGVGSDVICVIGRTFRATVTDRVAGTTVAVRQAIVATEAKWGRLEFNVAGARPVTRRTGVGGGGEPE